MSRWKGALRGVWGFFAPRYTPGAMSTNLVSATITTVTVVISCLIFGPQLGMISLMGAMTPVWETGRPFWARVRNSVLVSAGLTTSMAVGVLVAPYGWAIIPASVLTILVISLIYYTFVLTRGPSPVMMFYAAILGTYFGAEGSVGWSMVGVTAFASVVASTLLLIPLLFGVRRPEQRAVEAARRAVADYCGITGVDAEEALRQARNVAFQAVNGAGLTLESAWPADRGHRYEALIAELKDIDQKLAQTVIANSGGDVDNRPLSGKTPELTHRPSWGLLLSHSLRGDSVEWFTSWRMAVAAGLAGIVSELMGIGHPYWAILTATIVINQWIGRRSATRRAGQRTVGTVLGVGVVWGISAFEPSPWWIVVAVLICAIGQYLVLPLNYALALTLITPMALLAVEAGGAGGTVATLSFDRLIDTLIGAGAAVAVTWATSWHSPRRLVRSQSARSAAAIDAVEYLDEHDGPRSIGGRRARAELQYELIHHLSILERAVADDPRLASLAAAEHAVADRGYAALARGWLAVRSSHGRGRSASAASLGSEPAGGVCGSLLQAFGQRPAGEQVQSLLRRGSWLHGVREKG